MVALRLAVFSPFGAFVFVVVHKLLSFGGFYATTGLNAREVTIFCHGKKSKLSGI